MGHERARFEAMYVAHAPAVRAYALRRIDAAVADDVLSEVFLVAWRRLDDVPAEPRLWLLGVARRVAANHRRSAARWLALHQQLGADRAVAGATAGISGRPDGPAHVGDRHGADAEESLENGAVLHALAGLREGDRELLLLIGWDDLRPREAAAVLGLPAATVTMRLSRARKRFAAALDALGSTAQAHASSSTDTTAEASSQRPHASAPSATATAAASSPSTGAEAPRG
jgi:RNA polymerase sigma-70 factor (ECF subfamily)